MTEARAHRRAAELSKGGEDYYVWYDRSAPWPDGTCYHVGDGELTYTYFNGLDPEAVYSHGEVQS